MKTSDKAIEMIKTFEGFAEWPHQDNGQWSVGYGTGVSGDDLEYYRTYGITEAQATTLLKEYLVSFETSVNSFIDSNSLKLSQQQFDALVSFTYNLGASWMSGTGTFRIAVINGATGNDFVFAMAQYGKAGGKVVGGLVERRLCEANLYLNGVYSTEPPVNYKYVVFNSNLEDAVVTMSIQGYDTTSTAAVKSTASKSGYRFLGWYTKAEGGTSVTSLGVKTASISTLYGHWQNGDGELNEDGSIKGVAADYSGYAPLGAGQKTYKAPGGEEASTLKADTKLTVVAEYMDSDGVKWGKLSTGEWINVSNGLASSPVYEDASSVIDPITVTVTTGGVNNRVGPGTRYAKQGKFTKGQKLTLTAVQKGGNYKWGKSEEGWIALQYTDYDTVILQGSEEATKVTAIGTIIKTDVLNVRSGPGVSNTKVGYYYRNDTVNITLRQKVGSNTWGLTEKGWISLYYVKVTEVEEGTVPDIDISGGTTDDSNSSGGSTGSSGTSVIATGTVYNCSSLRIRSGAGTSNAQVGSYRKGTSVSIYETVTVNSDIWGRTDKGWICLRYVKLNTTSTGSTSTVTGTVYNCTYLNVRAGAGTNYAKVGKLAKGTKVTFLDYTQVGKTTWGLTSKGWISLYYVKLDAPIQNLDQNTGTGTGSTGGTTGTGTGTGSETTATEPGTNESEATKYTVTIADAANGKVTASAASAAEGTEVTLTVTPDAGCVLKTLTVKDASGAVVAVVNNKFTMPASNVTVTAAFKAQYNVKINTAAGGKVTASVSVCDPETEVILTVAPDAGYELDSLSVVNTATNKAVEVSSGKFVMPEADVNVVATFKTTTSKTYNVNVSDAANGKVIANTTTAKASDTVTLSVVPVADFVLDTLTVKDAANNVITCQAVSGKENTYSFEMPATNVTVVATFKAATYTVSITNSTPNGGTVSVNPAEYEKGATVTLIVTPASEQHEVATLTVKAGDTVIETTKDGSNYKFTMPAEDVTVVSSFSKIRYALNIVDTIGGTVTSDKETYAMNETVTVTIRPDTGYSRGTMVIKSASKEIEPTRNGLVFTFKMPGGAVNVEHTFKKNAYELNVKTNSYGVITADQETYGYNDVVTLTIKPVDGYVLNVIAVKNGTEMVELKEEGENKYSFVMPIPDDEVVVAATYKVAPDKYEVTYTGGDFVNIRDAGSNSGKDLGDIPNGTILEALEGSTSTWIKVTYTDESGKEITGWVAVKNLTKITE